MSKRSKPATWAEGRSPAEIMAEQQRVVALHAIRDRHAGNDGAVQCRRALDALQILGHLTTYEASRHLDLYDPRARIRDLRNAGHAIVTSWRRVPTESGRPHRIGLYTLTRGGSK